MALKIADKVEFTSDMSEVHGMKGIHLVRRVYKEDDSLEYAVACYCSVFTEGDEIIKVDNEQELTCPDCIEELERM